MTNMKADVLRISHGMKQLTVFFKKKVGSLIEATLSSVSHNSLFDFVPDLNQNYEGEYFSHSFYS